MCFKLTSLMKVPCIHVLIVIVRTGGKRTLGTKTWHPPSTIKYNIT